MNLQKYNLFSSFRKNQEEVITSIIKKVLYSKSKYIILEACTGSGKSLIAYIVAKYMADHYPTNHTEYEERTDKFSTYLLTSKNLLLDQYIRDFKEYLAVIKGGDNYKCLINKLNYKQGICHIAHRRLDCEKACPYKLARKFAMRNPITLSNFHYMILEMDYVKKFGTRDLLIIDEAHAIESVLMDYRTIDFTENTIKLLNSTLDTLQNCNYKIDTHLFVIANDYYQEHSNRDYRRYEPEDFRLDNIDAVNLLLEHIKTRCKLFIKALELGCSTVQTYDEDGNPDEIKDVKVALEIIESLKNLSCKISNYFKDSKSTEWVVQEHRTDVGNKVTGFEVKPVDVKSLANDIFNNMADKVVMMSATIGNKDRFCENIGIDPKNADFIRIPSDFPIENRPFYVCPIANINNSNIQSVLPTIVEFVDKMLEQFPNKKGIIHSVSFKNADYIWLNSKHQDRLLIHDEKNKDKIIEEFKNSENKVLMSPSLLEGFDFKGDLSEFQLFIKVPYLNLGDKAVARRMQLDPEWYAYNAIISIIQGTGRSVRSEVDQAVTFCLDGNIKRLLKNYDYLFTDDFRKTVSYL